MIHIERTKAPASLSSPLMQKERKRAAQFFAHPAEKRAQQRFKFFPVSSQLEGFKEALFNSFKAKCAFCETPVVESSNPTFMDSYRPKVGAIGLEGKQSPDHYWWLAYEWTNLYLACFVCNKMKGGRFPVEGERAAARAGAEALRAERPMLLDPCADRPEEHLLFDEAGKVASDTKQGRMTIDVFGLNRTPLIKARSEVFENLRDTWEATASHKQFLKKPDLTSLKQLCEPTQPFLAMTRQFLNHWSREIVAQYPRLEAAFDDFLAFRTTLRGKGTSAVTPEVEATALNKTFQSFEKYQVAQERYSVEEESQVDRYYLKTRLIERIEIHNFKIINDLDLMVPLASEAKGAWLLMLGENGTGKSTVLQAVALALMSKEHREHLNLDASRFVRYGCEHGFVRVHLTNTSTPIELRFRRGSKRFTSKEQPKILLLGYGATRLLPRDTQLAGRNSAAKSKRSAGGTKSDAAKADNLFNPFVPLGDATRWLCGLPEAEFDRIAKGLMRLMLLDDKEQLVRSTKGLPKVEVKSRTTRASLEDLSAGYQSVVALAADIMSVMSLRWDTMEAAEGIVLVDELDAHLHPRWRMRIVEKLRDAFPRVQFIVSSHDPLTLRGLEAGEVVVMRRDAKGRPMPIVDLPSSKGLRVDQLLTSEFFGLNSTIDPDMDSKFKRYYELLALRAPDVKERVELAQLKSEMEASQQLGTTRRERLMLEATDQFLAQEMTLPDAGARASLKKKAEKKIVDLWTSIEPLGGKSV